MMNESRKNKGQPDGSIDQITSLPDFYEDFRPEEIDEILSTAFAQRDRSIHHQNIFLFFTRCG
jgi:hypothetical protein